MDCFQPLRECCSRSYRNRTLTAIYLALPDDRFVIPCALTLGASACLRGRCLPDGPMPVDHPWAPLPACREKRCGTGQARWHILPPPPVLVTNFGKYPKIVRKQVAGGSGGGSNPSVTGTRPIDEARVVWPRSGFAAVHRYRCLCRGWRRLRSAGWRAVVRYRHWRADHQCHACGRPAEVVADF